MTGRFRHPLRKSYGIQRRRQTSLTEGFLIGVGRTGYPVPPPSEPYERFSRIRLSSWRFYLEED